MTRRGYYIRLAISIVIDLLNFTIGRVPIIGEGEDGVSSLILVGLWGPVGLISLWELADVTEQIDALIPTATLIALYVGWKKGFIGKANAPGATQVIEHAPRPSPPFGR